MISYWKTFKMSWKLSITSGSKSHGSHFRNEILSFGSPPVPTSCW